MPGGLGKDVPLRGPIMMVEDAFRLLRTEGLGELYRYYLGTAPFVFALVYFCADMARNPFAPDRMPGLVLILIPLFALMRGCQAAFAQALHARVSGQALERRSIAWWVRLTIRQSFVHSIGLVVLPLAFVFLLPFGHCYAFLQSYTIVGTGAAASERPAYGEAYRLAKLWPTQNHQVIWLCSPYLVIAIVSFIMLLVPVVEMLLPDYASALMGIIYFFYALAFIPLCPVGMLVAGNIGAILFFIPYLLDTFFGFETVLSSAPIAGLNSTVVMVLLGLTYLVLDPFMKTVYVLRCFDGVTRSTGGDLRQALRAVALPGHRAAVWLVLATGCLAGALGAVAQEATPERGVDPAALERALDDEFQQPGYRWQVKAEDTPEDSETMLGAALRKTAMKIREVMEAIREWIGDAYEWFMDRWFPDDEASPWDRGESGGGFWGSIGSVRLFVDILLALIVVVLVVFLYRSVVARRREDDGDVAVMDATPTPDLHNEDTRADELPEEAWMQLAREQLAAGNVRLAIRAMFLATLALLAERQRIRIGRSKSNLDYVRELARVAHAEPEMLRCFQESVGVYEGVWYGDHACDEGDFERLMRNREAMAADG